MKNLFEEPVINVQVFAIEDVLTTSVPGAGGDDSDDLGPGGLPVIP